MASPEILMTISALTLGVGAGAAFTYLYLKRGYRKKEDENARKAQKKISNLRFEHRLLMLGQDTILIVLDSQGKIILANDAARDFLYQKSLVGKTYQQCLKNEDLVSLIDESIRSKELIKRDLHLKLDSTLYSGKEEHFLNVNVKPVADSEYGNYTRILIQDVTERERNEIIRKDFVANASHELRTPLTIINGYVDTLMDDDMLDDQETSLYFLGIMKRHGQRLARIVEEMLMITKLESGVQNTLNHEPFQIKDCIEDCLSHLDQVIKEKNTKVKVKVIEPNLTLEADRFYWSQILFNLIENAIKQNPDREIRVNVGCHQCSRTNDIKIWISDNGCGIPAEDLPFIFRRFYRVAKDHSQQKIKGTGLGLSIVKRAVEAHKGEIDCISIPDRLTRFTITLPGSIRIKEEA